MGNSMSGPQRRKEKKRQRELPQNPPKPPAPLRPPITSGTRDDQAQCPLFSNNFPAELRLSIYELVLGDEHRYMHVIPFDDKSNWVGRCRCTVPAYPSAGPTWQHKCFGRWVEKNPSRGITKCTFNTRDNLLSLVLSCHRIYLEALDVLYTANKFSVKGARGVEAFHSVTPEVQWHNIRYLNISTLFLTPRIQWPAHESFPPDNYVQWVTSCALLRSLHGLRSLYVEIIVWDTFVRSDMSAVEEDALVSILEPLKQLAARSFEVELNFAPPDIVLNRLGELPFRLIIRKRPYDRIAFPL